MADITMPQLGETVTEGTITRWHKKVGDPVEEDEILYEVSTDKVDSEVPSPASGVLSEILVSEGETVEVGARLAVISDSVDDAGGGGDAAGGGGEAPDAGQEGGTGAEETAGDVTRDPAEAGDEAGAADDTGGGEAGGGGAGGGEAGGGQPVSETTGGAEGASGTSEMARDDVDEATGTTGGGDSGGSGGAPAAAGSRQQAQGPDPSPSGGRAPAQQAGSRPPDTRPGGRTDGFSKVLSPVVRRLISEHNLDPAEIQGTGAGGRITREDVLALVDQRGGARAGGSATAAGSQGRPAAPGAPAARPGGPSASRGAESPDERRPDEHRSGEREEAVPFSNIRRRTAEHMVRSLATSAHTLVATEVDYDAIDRVRLPEKERFRAEEGVNLTYLPFVARAVVDALRDFPHLNATVGDNELIVHRYVNLGFAVDMNFEGLIVPVVHDADTLRMRALARQVGDLAARARSRKLSADEISGGTFTITNPGGYGTLLTAPIISQPQVAILSTDGVRPRPVAVALPGGGYGVAVHPVGNLALSFDHRAVDGAYAAAFMARLREIIETRDWSQEL